MSDWHLNEPAEHDPAHRPLIRRNIVVRGGFRHALDACDQWGASVLKGEYKGGVVHLTVDITTRDVENWFDTDEDMLFYGPA